ncbi:MAG TPA: PAS domain-containing protein [Thermoanaerobaculia bacterium]|nr:PAS domain-containing protein [Thermoanaerobaculia bacterium]
MPPQLSPLDSGPGAAPLLPPGFLEAALGGIDDHFAIYDHEWRYVYVNQSAADVLGKTRAELLGRCIWELFPDAVGNQYHRELHQAVEEGRSIHSEHYYEPFDRWYVNHIYPFAGGVCVIAQDITKRKRAEAERDQLLALLEAVTRQMPAAVVIADTAGSLLFVNEQVSRVTGVPMPLQTGPDSYQPLLGPGYGTDGRRFADADWPLARACSGEVLHNEELTFERADGTRLILEASASPVRDAQGRVTAGVVVFQDVTERRRAENALREADRRKDEFLAMLAHELRNPLAPIRNSVQILRALGPANPQQTWCQDVIERQVGHLSRLVDDLLDLSRISQGKIALQRETVDLAEVVARGLETARPLIDGRRHHLELSLPERRVEVDGDLVRLSQVVGNLLSNAAKYMEPGGRIELSAALEEDGGQAVVRVRDHGIGMGPDLLPHVFDLFVQADRSLARSEGGLGIGLTLVRTLVEMHGGTVAAHSDGPGRGSELSVRLPVRPGGGA